MKENVTLSTTLAVPSQAKFHCFYVVNSCEKRVLKEIFPYVQMLAVEWCRLRKHVETPLDRMLVGIC